MLKNVVVVNDSNFISGGEDKVAIQMANLLVKNYPNINVYFFSANYSDSSELDERISSICLKQGTALANGINGIFQGIYNTCAKKELKKLLKNLKKDETIVHVHSWTKALTASVFDAAIDMGYHCTLTMHDYFTGCPNGGYFNYKKNEICKFKPLSLKCIKCNCDSRNYFFKLYRIIRQFIFNKSIKRIKNFVSISDFSENVLRSTLPKCANITRIYNPIDFGEFEKYDAEKNDYYLYVGRISGEKGVENFCEGVTRAGVKGIVVGDGDKKNELEDQYKSVTFVGWKKSFEVREYMKNARCLIIPSKWYECSPLTPIEAMMLGIPCISSNCNATIDYLKYDNGLIYSDISDLVDKINITKDDKIIKKMSANCYDYAIKFWKNDSFIENTVNYYNEVLQREGTNYED